MRYTLNVRIFMVLLLLVVGLTGILIAEQPRIPVDCVNAVNYFANLLRKLRFCADVISPTSARALATMSTCLLTPDFSVRLM